MSVSHALDNREIIEKALIVLAGFVASGLLGLLRLAVVGAQFGTGAAYDAFAAAQQLPESVFVLVAGARSAHPSSPSTQNFASSTMSRPRGWPAPS